MSPAHDDGKEREQEKVLFFCLVIYLFRVKQKRIKYFFLPCHIFIQREREKEKIVFLPCHIFIQKERARFF